MMTSASSRKDLLSWKDEMARECLFVVRASDGADDLIGRRRELGEVTVREEEERSALISGAVDCGNGFKADWSGKDVRNVLHLLNAHTPDMDGSRRRFC